MKNNVEYQIYIGCNDQKSGKEMISNEVLTKIVTQFFERKKVDFSMLNVKGGYLHENGTFVIEDTVCIDIIGAIELDIKGLAKSLAMFMDQECVMITRNVLGSEFR